MRWEMDFGGWVRGLPRLTMAREAEAALIEAIEELILDIESTAHSS
jgi:hypothetical protein